MTPQGLAEHLGGRQALGRDIRSDFDLSDAIRAGPPWRRSIPWLAVAFCAPPNSMPSSSPGGRWHTGSTWGNRSARSSRIV